MATLKTIIACEVLRALWKMVAVPGLTYANATLCLSAGVREFLERRQRDAGRMALGVHKKTPVEGIQGDVGWSSFTALEAVAKLSYEGRLLRLPDTNLAHQTLIHTIFSGISTRWTRRTANLRRRFEVPPESIASAAAQPVSAMGAGIRAQVAKVETREWLRGAKAKPSLGLYSTTKTAVGRETFFDNSLGSGLLAEARLGVLRTCGGRSLLLGLTQLAPPMERQRRPPTTSSSNARRLHQPPRAEPCRQLSVSKRMGALVVWTTRNAALRCGGDMGRCGHCGGETAGTMVATWRGTERAAMLGTE